jgi:recombination protein RecA
MAKKVSDEQKGRSAAAQTAIDQIKEKFGDGSIMRLGEARKMEVEAIPTGCLSLDLALGVFGVPRGRIIEVYGPEASGKTTLAQHIIAEAQKAGGIAAFVDAEHALDPDYARKIGVNVDEMLISQPDTGEQALDIVETLVRSNAIDVIVVDSVAALTPRAEIEGEMGDHHMGLQARLMSQALRKLTSIISRSKTTVIFINQIRMKIGVVFGNPETTTGGTALKFYSSMRIEVRRSAQIKMGEKIIGNRVKVKIVKNKVAAPFRTTEFDIMYNEGISVPGDLLDAGVELGVVNKSGNSYSFGGEKLGVGRENAKLALKERPALMKEMREKAIATWQEREQSGLSTTKADASEDESEEAPPAE